MKLLITSDVHGHFDLLKEVIQKHKDVNYHLNAGDMCLDDKISVQYHIITVKGNNDFRSNHPYDRILNLEDKIIFLTHGHHEHVKFGMERLKLKAKLLKANICVFGHTHDRYLFVEEGILFINPGALGDQKSYAIYENGQVTFMKG